MPSEILGRGMRIAADQIHAADTAWVLVSTALVLLMTLPGIALFYGGMVRNKNVINTMAAVVGVAAVVSVLWLGLGLAYPWPLPRVKSCCQT
jgi:Amt family ammonium transporter